MCWQYHIEWLRLMTENRCRRWDFLNKDIVERVLGGNPHYARCVGKKDNSGICKQVRQFCKYVDDSLQPPKDPAIDYGETAYALWLLGVRLPDNAPMLHSRVDEFFKGSTYYESDIAGFRQFLYEVQGICRLLEAGLRFDDLHEKEGEPDLLVRPEGEPFHLEIKMPVSSLKRSIEKAFEQLRPDERPRTALLVGLDSVLKRKGTDALAEQLALATAAVQGKAVVIVLEFPSDGSIEGGVNVEFVFDKDRHDAAVLEVMRKVVLCDP